MYQQENHSSHSPTSSSDRSCSVGRVVCTQTHEVTCQDRYKIYGTVFIPLDQDSEGKFCQTHISETAILMAPAMGIPCRFYKDFCTFICEEIGCIVMTFDYRGCFSSGLRVNAVVADNSNMDHNKKASADEEKKILYDIQNKYISIRNWGLLDVTAIMNFLESTPLHKLLLTSSDSTTKVLPKIVKSSEMHNKQGSENNKSVIQQEEQLTQYLAHLEQQQYSSPILPIDNFLYIAHSIGGQILAHIPSLYLQKFIGTVWVGTQSGLMTHWPWITPRIFMFFYWYVYLPMMVRMYPLITPPVYVANKLVRDWYSAGHCRRNYIFEYCGIEEPPKNPQHPAWALQKIPMVSYVIEGDNFAPLQSAMWIFRSLSDPKFVSFTDQQHLNTDNSRIPKTINVTLKKDSNTQQDDHVQPLTCPNEKRMYYIHGEIAKKVGHFNFFKRKDGRDECWPHILTIVKQMMENHDSQKKQKTLMEFTDPRPSKL